MSVSNNILKRVLATCYHFQLGHIGSCLSSLQVMAALSSVMTKTDLFILSKGHAGVLLYCTLLEEVKKNNNPNDFSPFLEKEVVHFEDDIIPNMKVLYEHPPRMDRLGILHTSGSLGHGLSVAIGHAYARKLMSIDGNVYVLMSDGEFDEGSNWEAFQFRQLSSLSNLRIIVDANGFQGYRECLGVDRLIDKLISFGVGAFKIDGDSVENVLRAFEVVDSEVEPVAILSVNKKDVLGMSGLDSHYQTISKKQYQAALKQIT